jgi:hypothetical protein
MIISLGSYFCQPKFERLCFVGRNRLNKPEYLPGISYIGHPHFAIGSKHFQTVTICHGFIFLDF